MKRTSLTTIGAVALLVGLGGCYGFGSKLPEGTLTEVPDTPNFTDHILPIMNMYCNDCHGDPATSDAPDSFRLDRCEDTNKTGARKYANRIVVRTLDTPSNPMPPSSYHPNQVSPIEADTLRRWVAGGAPCNEAEAGQGGYLGRVHPDNWYDGSDELGERHGVAARLNTGFTVDPALRGRTCTDARCHGAELRGGSTANGCDTCHDELEPNPMWRTNCTWCHGDPDEGSGMPPRSFNPNRTTDGFPQHAAHVYPSDLHGGFECEACHVVPDSVTSPGHLMDASPGVAEVIFETGGTWLAGACLNLYCHGDGRNRNGTIAINDGERGCTSCHPNQSSGRTGWRAMSGRHSKHMGEGVKCGECHQTVNNDRVNGNPTIAMPELHVNGQVEIKLADGVTYSGGRCSGRCHGEGHSSERW